MKSMKMEIFPLSKVREGSTGDYSCTGLHHRSHQYRVSSWIRPIPTVYAQFFFKKWQVYILIKVYTSSYDCTIRHLSFTTGISEEIFASSNGELICSIDLTSTGNEMWVSDGAGGATHIDLREKSSKHRRYVLSEQKIGCISINPTRNHFILTASNSRLLK
jgi:hypothetical protein